jgi:3-phosphoshikimate 1-carboxyvinyltransferase
MTSLRVHPATQPLKGRIGLPSDKSISHRALIFSALAQGRSRLARFSYGEDNVSTLAALRLLGVAIDDDGRGTLLVNGVGLDGFREPTSDLDCGNSGTTMRLMCGLLGAQPFHSRMVGDASLSGRPMKRVAEPLRMRGAVIDGRPHPKKAGDITAPLDIGPLPGGKKLSGLEYALPIASAQVKSALLLSGLFASGPTIVSEPLLSRDHTERMLQAMGAAIATVGTTVRLDPPGYANALQSFDVELPGDLSAAAFALVAGALVEGSCVTTVQTGTNPTRTGIIDILKAHGVGLGVLPQGAVLNEPVGELTVQQRAMRATLVAGEIATRAIDEIPIACALAARARGVTEIADVAELRVKESDRLAQMAQVLAAFGVKCEERPDGLLIEGKPEAPLSAAHVSSHGDHRIAMTAAVLALVADGPTLIEDAACIATSFPNFAGTFRALGANVEELP